MSRDSLADKKQIGEGLDTRTPRDIGVGEWFFTIPTRGACVMSGKSETRARLVGINHVALAVGDIDAALDFYGSIFEFELRHRSESKAFINIGDQFINLSKTSRTGDAGDMDRHFGLVVDDKDLVTRRLESLEIDLLPTPYIDFHDPWGNRVQVVAYQDIQFTKPEHVLHGMGLEEIEKTDDALRELAEKGLEP